MVSNQQVMLVINDSWETAIEDFWKTKFRVIFYHLNIRITKVTTIIVCNDAKLVTRRFRFKKACLKHTFVA